MQAVLVLDMTDMQAFRRDPQNSRAGPITFVPTLGLAQANQGMLLFGGATDVSSLPDLSWADGFVGFAVRLLRLQPHNEHLRDSALLTLLKDLMVFDTRAHAAAFLEIHRAGPDAAWEPWLMTLEEYDTKEHPARGWFASGRFRFAAEEFAAKDGTGEGKGETGRVTKGPSRRCTADERRRGLQDRLDATRSARAFILYGQ